MCAAGRYDITRSPGSASSTARTASASAITLACVSSTPFGGPVVPDV
jgi:hypothetical protein